MKFKQTTGDFIASKSNWTGMVMITGGVYGGYTKAMDLTAAIQMILGGIAVISIKDAVSRK
jgi:hypothetical protein